MIRYIRCHQNTKFQIEATMWSSHVFSGRSYLTSHVNVLVYYIMNIIC